VTVAAESARREGSPGKAARGSGSKRCVGSGPKQTTLNRAPGLSVERAQRSEESETSIAGQALEWGWGPMRQNQQRVALTKQRRNYFGISNG
jgi:hypothetical protein